MFLEKDIGNPRCFSIANRLRKLYNIVIEKDLIIWKRNLYQQSVIIKLHLVLIVNGKQILPANCFMVLITVTKKITTEMFIAMCGLNKNINLDFSKSVYINCRTPITINCKLHGEFDGSHHFKPIKYGRSQTIEEQHKKFESIKDGDGKKLTYAMDNRINMIRIMYTRINDLKHILNYEILDINTNITLDTPYITYLMENNTPVWSIKGYS